MALENKAFNEVVTFTRSSSAHVVNSAGVLEYVSTDVPRITHDPVTLQPLGILKENITTNIHTASENSERAAWTKTNVTVHPFVAKAPNGKMAATKVIPTQGVGTHTLFSPTSAQNNKRYGYSIFVKQDELRYVQLAVNSTMFGANYANFDLQTGTITNQVTNGTANGGGNADCVFEIEPASLGYYRIMLTATSKQGSTASAQFQLVPLRTGNESRLPSDITFNGKEGFLIWGGQVENNNFPSSYIPNLPSITGRASVAWEFDATGDYVQFAADTTRPAYRYDGSTWVLAGNTTEASRTNKIVQSSVTVAQASTATNVTDGVGPVSWIANGIVFPASATDATFYNAPTSVTNDVAAWLTLIVEMDDGSKPVVGGAADGGADFSIMVGGLNMATATSSVLNFVQVSATAWMLQQRFNGTAVSTECGIQRSLAQSGKGFKAAVIDFQEGTHPTTPIITTGSSFTRAADTGSDVTSTRLGDVIKLPKEPWFRGAVAGTLYFKGTIKRNQTSGIPRIFSVKVAGAPAAYPLYVVSSLNEIRMFDDGSTVTLGALPASGTVSIAISWDSERGIMFGAVGNATIELGTYKDNFIPDNDIGLMSMTDGLQGVAGTVEVLKYYPRTLADVNDIEYLAQNGVLPDEA